MTCDRWINANKRSATTDSRCAGCRSRHRRARQWPTTCGRAWPRLHDLATLGSPGLGRRLGDALRHDRTLRRLPGRGAEPHPRVELGLPLPCRGHRRDPATAESTGTSRLDPGGQRCRRRNPGCIRSGGTNRRRHAGRLLVVRGRGEDDRDGARRCLVSRYRCVEAGNKDDRAVGDLPVRRRPDARHVRRSGAVGSAAHHDGRPEWSELDVFATNEGRQENADLLHLYLGEWMAEQHVDDLYRTGAGGPDPVHAGEHDGPDRGRRAARGPGILRRDPRRPPRSRARFPDRSGLVGSPSQCPDPGEHDGEGWLEREASTTVDRARSGAAHQPSARWGPGLRLHLGVGRPVLHPIPGASGGRRHSPGIR